MNAKGRWPFDFPNCPPDGAVPTDGIYYRGVDNDPPQCTDFLSRLEEGKRWKPGQSLNDCTARGVSLFEDIEGIKRTIKRVKGFNPRYIAEGRLRPEDGVGMKTFSPGHVTWWPDRSAVRERGFLVKERVGA